jgi:hypothetical protein
MGPPCLARLGKVESLWGDLPSVCANCPLVSGMDKGSYCKPHQRVSRLWSYFIYKASAVWILGSLVGCTLLALR